MMVSVTLFVTMIWIFFKYIQQSHEISLSQIVILIANSLFLCFNHLSSVFSLFLPPLPRYLFPFSHLCHLFLFTSIPLFFNWIFCATPLLSIFFPKSNIYLNHTYTPSLCPYCIFPLPTPSISIWLPYTPSPYPCHIFPHCLNLAYCTLPLPTPFNNPITPPVNLFNIPITSLQPPPLAPAAYVPLA